MSTSNVLKHFEVPENIGSGNFKAKYKHCSSMISGSTVATSNFVTHMRRKHRDTLRNATKVEQQEQGEDIRQHMTGRPKYNSTDSRQQQITDSLITFIAGDLVSLSTVESVHFKALIEKLGPRYQLPSRKHLSSKLLHEKSSDVRSKLICKLNAAESVCLTIDLWSNRQMRGYMGITGHFIRDWTLNSVMICCKRFKGKHTAKHIRCEYKEVVSCFGLGHKINTIVSDNASNMVKVFSLPGCDPNEPDHSTGASSGDYDSDITDSDSENDGEAEADCRDCLPQHTRCYAHTIQLVVKDGPKEVSGHLRTVLAKASKIVYFVRKSILPLRS